MKLTSIGTKIQLLSSVAFLLGLASVFSYQTYSRVQSTWVERMDANLRIVKGLAAPAKGAIALHDKSVINSYMELLSSDPRASGIVLTSHNSIMVSQQSIDHFDLPIHKLTSFALQAEALGQTSVMTDGDYEFIAVPVKDGALRTTGAIGIAWSVKGLLDGVWATALREALGLLAVLAGVSLVLALAMRKIVTAPLKSIAAMIEKPVTHDDQDIINTAQEFESRSDEIGIFARGLSRFYKNAAETSFLHNKLDSALTNMTQGLCMFDKSGKLILTNSRFSTMYELDISDVKIGISQSELSQAILQNGVFKNAERSTDKIDDLTWITGSVLGTATHDLPSGKTITVSCQRATHGGWVVTHTDVTALKAIERKLFHLANHDPLTGLPNRRRFHECVNLALGETKEDKRGVAVLFLDLDKFKAVNDTMGHVAGDALLKTVADRLTACVRQGDIVCRLGGDEFAILQLAVNQPQAAEELALRVTKVLSEPVEIDDHQACIGVSIGIALSPNNGIDADTLLKHADIAVYVAKEEGRNTYRFYIPSMSDKQQHKHELESELRDALELNQLELYYQPIVDLKTNKVTSCEALIRWHHPTRGLMLPNDFIPVAEETGLIVPIGEWVIKQATQQAALWPLAISVSVNVSSLQLQRGDFARTVFSALAASKIMPGRLHLEITESVLIRNDSETMVLLHKLQDFGVHIVLDDFGTGFSCLNYLSTFPFDKIKVDRVFVNGLDHGKVNDTIINAVVSIGQSLKISTVAEGVETQKQRDHLTLTGINEMQGYVFSKPLRASDVEKLFFSAAKSRAKRFTA